MPLTKRHTCALLRVRLAEEDGFENTSEASQWRLEHRPRGYLDKVVVEALSTGARWLPRPRDV